MGREAIKSVPYEDTVADKPPIPVTRAKASQNAPFRGINAFRKARAVEQISPYKASLNIQNETRRDSGLANSSYTAKDSRTTLCTEPETANSARHSPSLRIVCSDDDLRSGTESKLKDREDTNGISRPFLGILTEIPTGSFEDLTMPGQVQFSKRGSMLIAGKKVNNSTSDLAGNGRMVGSRRTVKESTLKPPSKLPSRILSTDEESLSRKVRSMYQADSDQLNGQGIHANGHSTDTNKLNGRPSPSGIAFTNGGNLEPRPIPSTDVGTVRSDEANVHLPDLLKAPNELAGGIEDWEDLNGVDVDRYGFIVPRKLSSQPSSMHSARPATPDPPRLQRVSTLLQLASDTPRRNRSRLHSGRSAKSPARSAGVQSSGRDTSATRRPMSSQSSYRSTSAHSRMRFATNRLPHNKDRRCVDEAGDMLTLPPGLADIAEEQQNSRLSLELRQREWNRDRKWRKMAKQVKRDEHGGGMRFEFDTSSQRLIERTWKGIPDKWRSTAWHAFLTTSARRRKDYVRDEELIRIFQGLVDQGSPDDVQIDIDVPRTVNSHIMFRRRYRGGQRLLFRVLHCVSIYFPDTGYVQGMAALAATLLCYFDEEMAFVMMVRLWQLRGLERLYKAGFEGLMQALEEFEKEWLRDGEVASKLVS